MKRTFTLTNSFILSILCCLALAFGATAQQTKKISLQGFLKDANGKAVADGQQSITFKLYTVAAGGTAQWTDTQTINVFGGVYSTHLGSVTNPLDNLNWGASTYYVGVTVQGVELTPRTELTFAPYSLGSPKAQEVVCSGAVGDVKYSILGPTQFAAVNGDCWVPMDGRALLATDKLRVITGMTTIPDGSGAFIRSQEFDGKADRDPNRTSASPIATLQDQATQQHTHAYTINSPITASGTATGGGHSHSITFPVKGSDGGDGEHYSTFTADNTYRSVSTNSGGEHSHSVTVNGTLNVTGTTTLNGIPSENETRPKNLNFWVYIRIN